MTTFRSFLFCLIFTAFSAQTYAQELLNIPTQNRCTASGTEWDDELYRFEANPKVQTWITDICAAGGVSQNFEVIQASVENVAAIYDPTTNKRYLLFSQNFIEKATRASVYAALAHEIGHHVSEHRLTAAMRNVEELEADEFMGYVLQKLNGFGALEMAQKTIDILPTSYPSVISPEKRREAIKTGWQRAESLLIIKKQGDYANDPNYEKLLKAQFPFPPPQCCSPLEIPRSTFGNALKLGDVSSQLIAALNQQGYVYRSFMSVPNGFAIVTQMEQYNADYTHRTDENRWNNAPIGTSFSGYLDYFLRLVMPSKAYFRTFVFIVTTDAITQNKEVVGKDKARDWYSQGINRLPKTVAELPYTEGVEVTALVYEFVVPDSNRQPKQNCPSVNTQLHLQKSGIFFR